MEDPGRFESKEYFIIRASKYEYKTIAIDLNGIDENIVPVNIPADCHFKEILANVTKQNGAGWR
jgi:hypothetical protein